MDLPNSARISPPAPAYASRTEEGHAALHGIYRTIAQLDARGEVGKLRALAHFAETVARAAPEAAAHGLGATGRAPQPSVPPPPLRPPLQAEAQRRNHVAYPAAPVPHNTFVVPQPAPWTGGPGQAPRRSSNGWQGQAASPTAGAFGEPAYWPVQAAPPQPNHGRRPSQAQPRLQPHAQVQAAERVWMEAYPAGSWHEAGAPVAVLHQRPNDALVRETRRVLQDLCASPVPPREEIDDLNAVLAYWGGDDLAMVKAYFGIDPARLEVALHKLLRHGVQAFAPAPAPEPGEVRLGKRKTAEA